MKPIPPYIYKRSNQLIMVLFVPLFCMAFIFIYHPSDFDTIDKRFFNWAPINEDTGWHIAISAIAFIGMIVAALSRWSMDIYSRAFPLSYKSYILWIVGEIIAMTLVYSGASSLVSDQPFFTIYEMTFNKTVRTLVIPYVICYIYFIWQERAHQMKMMRKQMEEDEYAQTRAFIQIADEKGKLQLSVKRENILYLESADNYVSVYYLNNNLPKKIMVRNTLKKLAPSLEGTNIRRCHRSYMVNLDHVKVMKREKEGVFLELGTANVPEIPLSKTYHTNVSEWLLGGAAE